MQDWRGADETACEHMVGSGGRGGGAARRGGGGRGEWKRKLCRGGFGRHGRKGVPAKGQSSCLE